VVKAVIPLKNGGVRLVTTSSVGFTEESMRKSAKIISEIGIPILQKVKNDSIDASRNFYHLFANKRMNLWHHDL
jgi:hypothetical protein